MTTGLGKKTAVGDVASEMALWQLVEMPREACLDEGAQRGKRVLGCNVPYDKWRVATSLDPV